MSAPKLDVLADMQRQGVTGTVVRAVATLALEALRAERALREMAEAGFGDLEQADSLRAALKPFGGAA
jgi:hypothetical protein